MWLNLDTIPAEGKTIVVDDPTTWTVPLQEFGMTCRIVKPLRGEVTLLPQNGEGMNGGCLIRGKLTGEVALPCNRCAEDAHIVLDNRFESFEPVPEDELDVPADSQADEAPEDVDEAVIRRENGVAQINPAALMWEEFLLALPVKPVCRTDCKGLCPVCGINRNEGSCACIDDEGDPRLAVLRGLTVEKKTP